MSLKAMTWALEDAPVTDATALLILWALADRAHDDGTAAWPSVEWIAHRARCSPRTVHRHLRTLESAGVIARGDQRYVAHLRGDHRPIVWELNMAARRGDNLSPRQRDGVTPEVARGDTGGTHGVTPEAPRGDTVGRQTVLDPSLEPSLEPQEAAPTRSAASEVAAKVYEGTTAAVAYLKARGMAAAVFKARPNLEDAHGVERVADALLGLYRAGKPMNTTMICQVLDGFLPLNGAPSARSARDRSAFSDDWATGAAQASWDAVADPRPVR